jgi:hypothetical protein
VKRILATCCSLACLLGAPGAAYAASATGTISQVGQSFFTITSPGRTTGIVAALTGAASRVTQGDYPYVWGGGHAQAGVASVGIKGPGHNGKRVGYDCSGSVAAVLSGAGLWPAGAGVPSDAGVVSQLLQSRLIARGAGTGPVEVTLYDDPGVHIFMNIDGRFFGTSDGGGGGNPRGGAGWLDDGAPDAYSKTYKRYHLLPSALRGSTDAGHSMTFQLGQLDPSAVLAGVKAQVSYQQTASGTLAATSVSYPGATTATGTIQTIATDGSSLTVQPSTGSALTFVTTGLSQLLASLVVGDTVQISYVKSTSGLVPLAVTVTATAVPPAPASPATPTSTTTPTSSPTPSAGGGPPSGSGYGG